MKKYLFLLPLAALAMAACSSEELVETGAQASDNNILQIRTAMGDVTRGTVWNDGNFVKFHLSTSGAFAKATTEEEAKTASAQAIEQDVTKSGGTWTIAGLGEGESYWWPSKKTQSSFEAYAPVDCKPTDLYTADNVDLAKLQDIVVAYNSGNASDFLAGVPLYFRHITSQIVIKADNNASSKVKIEVKAIRLNNIKSQGQYSMPSASTVESMPSGYTPWSGVTIEKSYTANLVNTMTLTGASADITGSNPLLMIPQQLKKMETMATTNATNTTYSATGQYISVLVKITTTDETPKLVYPKNSSGGDSDFAWAAVDVNTNWEPGKKYIYTLHFTEGGYGKVDPDTTGGNTDPGNDDDPGTDDPKPGDDVEDSPVKLTLDVKVVDWEEVTEAQNM
ncbi:MAG: fimbrillin family protein [Prevotella sp.]|nr:fimbrillin family protein [Prevotella sp.]